MIILFFLPYKSLFILNKPLSTRWNDTYAGLTLNGVFYDAPNAEHAFLGWPQGARSDG